MPQPPSSHLQELCNLVSTTIGGLDDLESSLNQFNSCLSSSVVSHVIDACKNEAPTRRLLRFFLWSHKYLDSSLKDQDFNHAIRVLAEKKDHLAVDILVSELRKEGRTMEKSTFSIVAEALVKLDKEEQALGIFKNLDKFRCPQDGSTVSAIVNALCARGHAHRANIVILHHKEKISGFEHCVYRSLLYGWCLIRKLKEARNVMKEMRSAGIIPDMFCYNTLLKCICERNLKGNPSALVPDALELMMEMRSNKIFPTSITYNILLSRLGRRRRVKESLDILNLMKQSGCNPDWATYYLVARVLYLSGKFGKGNEMVTEMVDRGLVPDRKFYYDLIGVLIGVKREKYAVELFELMKRNAMGGYGPVYDMLIPKLCRAGKFDKGRELWEEATANGLTISCDKDLLDPAITEVFKPVRKEEEVVSLKSTNEVTKPSRYQIKINKRSKRKK
ncbi:hypothetical protein ACFE04_009176 [Oxalis oulophora]